VEDTSVSAHVLHILHFFSVVGKSNRKRDVKKIEEKQDRRSTTSWFTTIHPYIFNYTVE